MKKILLFIILLVLSACSQTSYEQQQYNEYYKIINNENNFKSLKQLPFDIQVNVNEHTIKKYHYEFIIDNPKLALNDLKVAILPMNFKNDEIIPTFNIIESIDITSFNKNESKIKLNYFSDTRYKKFKLLVEYNDIRSVFLITK